MKNKELIVKFAPVARKNLNKTFFTLFIIVILESLCSALFVGTSLLLNSMQDSFAVTFFSYSLMFCGVFFWFLILSGFATMLLRMARDEFVTIGFLFYGFRRFKQFAPAAFLYTLLTGISAAVVAGTTRDAIDTKFENEHGKYVFIDTAGIRRKSKVTENLEKYSVMRSLLAVERADVCILMIDANEGVTDQDAKIAGEAHEAGKGVIIAVNKWDEYEKDTNTTEKYKKEIYNKLSYLSYAPIIFISAKTGQRVNKLYELINEVANQNAADVNKDGKISAGDYVLIKNYIMKGTEFSL